MEDFKGKFTFPSGKISNFFGHERRKLARFQKRNPCFFRSD